MDEIHLYFRYILWKENNTSNEITKVYKNPPDGWEVDSSEDGEGFPSVQSKTYYKME